MRRIRFVCDYVGTRFSGWQRQADKDTVQQRIEEALQKLTGEEKINVVASGRTDAGVHALAQVAHFDTETQFDEIAYVRGTNNYLPPDIRILSAQETDESFHARFSAVRKTYCYRCYVATEERAIYHNRAHRVRGKLDVESIRAAADILQGKHDFASFMSTGSEVKTTVRTLFAIKIERVGEELFFYLTADGFLYNMVRKIVAFLLDVGSGKKTVDDAANALEHPDVRSLTAVAPACGLYLVSVEYPS